MKKTILPSKGLFALSIVAFVFLAVLIWGCIYVGMLSASVGLLIYIIRNLDIFNAFLLFTVPICMLLLLLCFALMLYGALELFMFAGRPVKFSEDTISLGYIKKKRYYKKNITGIGIAPWIEGSKGLGIYIALGDYNESDFSKFGIMTVWELVEFRKVLPKVVEFLHRVGPKYLKTDDTSNIQRCDGLLWMTYTEENMRFLQNWLGSKFDEVTQR